MSDADPTPVEGAPPVPDPQPAAGEVPTERDDLRRIAADEERLEHLTGDIDEARRAHEEHERSWQSGLLPQAEGDEGEGNASRLRG